MNIQADICLWLVQIVFFFILSISPYLVRGHSYITSGKRGQKMVIFSDVADVADVADEADVVDIVGVWAKKVQVYVYVI